MEDTALFLKNENWHSQICQYLYQLRLKRELCDVRLKGEYGQLVSVHSCVLAAASPFLHQHLMSVNGGFGPENDVILEFNYFSETTLEYIIKFLYLGELELPLSALGDLTSAAEFLQIKGLHDLCLSYKAGGNITQGRVLKLVDFKVADLDPDLKVTDLELGPQDSGEFQTKVESQESNVIDAFKPDADIQEDCEVVTASGSEDPLPKMEEDGGELVEITVPHDAARPGSQSEHVLLNLDSEYGTYSIVVDSDVMQPHPSQSTMVSDLALEGHELLADEEAGVGGHSVSYMEVTDDLEGEPQPGAVLLDVQDPGFSVDQMVSVSEAQGEMFGLEYEHDTVVFTMEAVGDARKWHARCNLCDKSFDRHDDLKSHMTVHLDTHQYSCEVCGRLFKFKSSARLHMVRHGKKAVECRLCDKSFYTKSDLDLHMRSHTGQRPYNCSLCNKGFSARSLFLKHRIKKHKEEVPGVNLDAFTCAECGKGFPLQCELTQHIKIVHGHHYICQHCDKTFHFQKELKAHLHEEHGGKGEVVKAPNNPLQALYECYICKKKMRCPSAVTRHLENAHQKVKRYFCDVEGCGYRTYWPYDMKVHMQRHVTSKKLAKQLEKPIDVPEKNVHSLYTVSEDGSSAKVFQCRKCPRVFRTQSAIVCHIEGVHYNIKRFFCQIEGCHYASYRKTDLQSHLLRHRSSKRLENKLGKTMPVTDVQISDDMLNISMSVASTMTTPRPRSRKVKHLLGLDDTTDQETHYDPQDPAVQSMEMVEIKTETSARGDDPVLLLATTMSPASTPGRSGRLRKPKMAVCYCCGREILASSMDKHLEKCAATD